MYRILRRLLFLLDAERAHSATMRAFGALMAWGWLRRLVRRRMEVRAPELRQTVCGVAFSNPVGLAAGFDKDAHYVSALGALGFGSIEIGTLTALAQPGNPRPRLFRLRRDRALLNRMGFNNGGSEAASERLAKQPSEVTLGINIGKSKACPLEEAASDYATSLERLFDHAAYVTVNVSSPNTPGLRALQAKEPLSALLAEVSACNKRLATERGVRPRPIFLKLSPDLGEGAIREAVEVAEARGIDGLIATNTTIARDGLTARGADELGAGGISGRPLTERARGVVALMHEACGGRLPIIGVGGIFSAADALAMFEAGATLLQVWTGFVYEGPAIARRINLGLLKACRARGLANVSELRAPRRSEAREGCGRAIGVVAPIP